MTISWQTPIDSAPDNALWQSQAAVDGHYADWLLRRGLLTPDLQASLGEAVAIHVISEGYSPIVPGWTADIAAPAGAPGWCREITMSFSGRVYVHAQCYAPAETIDAHPWLGSLGSRPLGSALAELDDTRRIAMDFSDNALADAIQVEPESWARRSVFEVQGHPLFLIEYLSPALADVPRESH